MRAGPHLRIKVSISQKSQLRQATRNLEERLFALKGAKNGSSFYTYCSGVLPSPYRTYNTCVSWKIGTEGKARHEFIYICTE